MTARAKAAPKRLAYAKSIATTDAQMLVGTLADSRANSIPDNDIYWFLYKKHPWIRSCVRLISNAVAAEGFSVSQIAGDDAQTAGDDPREAQIKDFFRLAFAPKTQRMAFKATAVDLEIYGVAYYLKKHTGKLLTGLERLDPRLMVPKLNAEKTEIESYSLRRNQLSSTGVIVEQAGEQVYQADDIVRFSLDEGGDAVFGSPSPLEALDLTADLDLNIRRHRNSFFRNGATVGNVLINTDATEESVRAAEKALRARKVGAGSAYETLVLTGNWEVKSLMQSGKQDIDFATATEIVRDEICAVFGVPVSKLMDTAGAMGQAGKGEDDETFEQECILPLEELIYETLTFRILAQEFDIHDLELVPRRRNALRYDRIQSALSLVKAGGTGNEARSIIGLAPSDKPGMDIPLFIGATGQAGVASDEATAPEAPIAAPNAALESVNDENEDEVAQKGAKRFRYYR